jgi:hypothetical protein
VFFCGCTAGGVLWHNWSEPYDYLSNFLIHNEEAGYSLLKRKVASQTWLVLDVNPKKDCWSLSAAKREPNLHEVKIELTWPKARVCDNTSAPAPEQLAQAGMQCETLQQEKTATMDTARDDGVYFAMHMPPKLPNSRNQPFSSINDGVVLLPDGYVFQIRARISKYRNLKTKKYRCTNGVSMSDWQVSCRIALQPTMYLKVNFLKECSKKFCHDSNRLFDFKYIIVYKSYRHPFATCRRFVNLS